MSEANEMNVVSCHTFIHKRKNESLKGINANGFRKNLLTLFIIASLLNGCSGSNVGSGYVSINLFPEDMQLVLSEYDTGIDHLCIITSNKDLYSEFFKNISEKNEKINLYEKLEVTPDKDDKIELISDWIDSNDFPLSELVAYRAWNFRAPMPLYECGKTELYKDIKAELSFARGGWGWFTWGYCIIARIISFLMQILSLGMFSDPDPAGIDPYW